MKKYLAIMMCVGLLFTATGCGEEKREESSKNENTKENTKVEEKAKRKILTCSQSYQADEMLMENTFIYDLDGKEFSDATVNYTIKVRDEDIDKMTDEQKNSFCEMYSDYLPVKECNAGLDGNKFETHLKIDIDKLDKDEDGFTKDTPIEELKEYMEELNDVTTCKIEEKMIFME